METEGAVIAAPLSAVEQQANDQAAHRRAFLRRRFSFPQPDTSPIYEWARKHVNLIGNYATGGAFSVDTSPWLKDIFDALQDETVRTVSFLKPIQSGGTMIADIWIPWLIVNDPGPLTFTFHTDDKAEEHAKTRLNSVLDNCRPVAALLPRPGPFRTITQIYFGGFSVILNAANLSDQQSQSVRYKINDELWHPKWQSVYADAVGRVSAYEAMGTSKVFNISQAGIDSGESTTVDTRVFRAGHAAEWSAPCPSCARVHPLTFGIRAPDAAPEAENLGGVVWEKAAKGDDDIWDVGRAVESCRFRCPHCGHESADTDATREGWKRVGRYVPTNLTAPATNRSFHVDSIVSRSMKLLTAEWLDACNEATRTGNTEPMMKFRQKREAKPWRVEKTAINLLSVAESTYTIADYFDGTKRAPDEVSRCMTIDRQMTHWWALVGAWSSASEFTLFWFGRVDTVEQLRAIQQRYRVPDQCVVEDRKYQPAKTDEDCARYGWRGMQGGARKTWTLTNQTTGQLDNYPYNEPKYSNIGGGVSVPFYEVSPDHAKDLLFNAINGKGFAWNMPKDCPPLYLEQLKSEVKEQVRPGVWKYVEVRQNFNHAIDCSAMAVMFGIITEVVRFKLDAPE